MFTRIQKANAITVFCKEMGLPRPKYLNGHSAPTVTPDKKRKAMSLREIDDYMAQLGISDEWIYEARKQEGYKKYLKSLATYDLCSID